MRKMVVASILGLSLFMGGNGVQAKTNCSNLSENVHIYLTGEDKGYYENSVGDKVNVKDNAEVEKMKEKVVEYLDEHLQALCEKNVDVKKILKTYELEIEIYPYQLATMYGYFMNNYELYLDPVTNETVWHDRDRIMFFTQNNPWDKEFVFNEAELKYTLTHEVGHYIEHNYLRHADYMEFLTIKNLHETDLVNNIYNRQVEWGQRPSEIFAENYAELFMAIDSKNISLKAQERESLERFILNKINGI